MIKAEPKLFELYHMDRRVLLRLKAIDALQRKESAQALYTYIESLPQNPAPISMKRMRDRLNLTSNVYTQNHTVRKAMEQLVILVIWITPSLNVAEPPLFQRALSQPQTHQ